MEGYTLMAGALEELQWPAKLAVQKTQLPQQYKLEATCTLCGKVVLVQFYEMLSPTLPQDTIRNWVAADLTHTVEHLNMRHDRRIAVGAVIHAVDATLARGV